MKKSVLTGLVLTLLVPAAALAAETEFEFDPETGSILDYTGTALEVVVPSEIDGVPVVRIGYDAFKNNDVQLTSIILPEGLEIIDEDAFHWQASLVSVDCPDSVRVIAEDAFNYGYFGEEFDWPEALEEIGICGFYGTGLTGTVVLPPNVAKIGESAFGATGITQVVLPSADVEIEGNAFEDCDALREIVVPSDTTDERLAELAALFAEENPDAQIVRAEPAISEEDFARFGGLWYLNTMTESGITFSAADMGMNFTLQLNEDGTGVLDTGEPQDASWAVDGDTVILSAPETDDVIFTEADGVLTAAEGSTSMTFGREPAEPGYIPGEPVASERADDFNGTWSCTRISAFDMNVPAELFADSMQDYFGFDSMSLKIRGTAVCMINDVIETFVFTEGALVSQEGIQRTLTLLDDGMLACDVNDGTFYYEKVSDESDLPEETEAITEAVTEVETEAATEAVTEPVTETLTEAVTETETRQQTEEPVEPETQNEPETEPETQEPETAPDPEPMYDIIYTGTKATVSGYTFDPSTLGGEYTASFHADGSAGLMLAGALLQNLTWHTEDGVIIAEHEGMEPLQFIPSPEGFELDYVSAVRLYFTAE